MRRLLALLLTCGMALAAGPVDELVARSVSDARAFGEVVSALAALGPDATGPLLEIIAGADGRAGKAAWRALQHVAQAAEGARRAAYAAILVTALGQDRPVAVKAKVVELLGLIGGDAAVAALVGLLADEALREPARQALARIPGEVAHEALVDRLAHALGPWQEALLGAVVTRADGRDEALLASYLTSPRPELVVLALDGLGRVAGAGALPVVEALLGRDGAVKAAALDALLAIARRASPDVSRPVYARLAARPEEPVAVAALAGLGVVGGSPALPVLFAALGRPGLVAATAQEMLATMPGDAVGEAIRAHLAGATPAVQVPLLEALVQREGAGALVTATALAAADDERLATTAMRLLAGIGTAETAALLLGYARAGRHNPAALAAYLSITETLGGPGLLAALSEGLRVATRDDERRQALSALARLGEPAALELVQSYLAQDGTRRPAAEAVLRIAEVLHERGEPERAKQLMSELVGLGYRDIGNRAAGVLRRLGSGRDFAGEAGFLTRWHLVGPFANDNNTAATTAFFPETEIALDKKYEVGKATLGWRAHITDDVMGVVDLKPLFKPNDNVAAYAYTELTAAAAREALLKVGSDDGVVIWLNGAEVHRQVTNRALSLDQDTVKVKLEAGTNRLLLKVLQGGGGWEFAVRLTDTGDRPLPRP